MWDEIVAPQRMIQHGDNPEAVLVVDMFTLRYPHPEDDLSQRFREFADRCHRHDDKARWDEEET